MSGWEMLAVGVGVIVAYLRWGYSSETTELWRERRALERKAKREGRDFKPPDDGLGWP
jgi:hypothetical protein